MAGAMLRAIPDMMFVMGADGVYVDYHAPDPTRLALRPEQFLGRNVRDVLPPELAARIARALEEVAASGAPSTLEYELAVGGEMRHWEARLVPCEADKVLIIVRDRTAQHLADLERSQLRQELAHVGRVTSLTALTGSLAHEINQPLCAIMANAQAMLRLLDTGRADPAQLREALADIVEDDRRAGNVVARLRGLMAREAPRPVALDLGPLLQDVLSLVHSHAVLRRVTLDVRIAPDLPAVRGDRVQLQQVVLNLLMNACDAVEGLEADRRRVVLEAFRQDGEAVVAVVDHGPGVAGVDCEKVFEPFFTTKPQGMGLGLSICRTIADAHGGALLASPHEGQGMIFSLRLPASS